MHHFVKHTKASTDARVLLFLDNYDSHLSVACINYCKENGVTLLTFSSLCSHKLQPLNRGVFGPFKRLVNAGCDSWMKMNSGKTMSIYDISRIVKTALPLSVILSNIQSGFQCSGIWPVNRNIFIDADFALSSVTDRPKPLPVGEPVSLATTSIVM